MFKIGQVFHKNGFDFCILDILEYESKQYLLCSVEKDKLEYIFYDVHYESGKYNLVQVLDQQLEFNLFELFEQKGGIY